MSTVRCEWPLGGDGAVCGNVAGGRVDNQPICADCYRALIELRGYAPAIELIDGVPPPQVPMPSRPPLKTVFAELASAVLQLGLEKVEAWKNK